MDAQIKNMVPNHIKPVDVIIKSKGKVGQKTAGPEIPDVLQMGNIFDG